MNLLHHPHPLPEEQDHHESPPTHCLMGHSPMKVSSLTPRLDPVNPAGQPQKRAKPRGSCWDSGAQLPIPQPLLHSLGSRHWPAPAPGLQRPPVVQAPRPQTESKSAFPSGVRRAQAA